MKPAIEEYPPGPGSDGTLEGFRIWCERRNQAEAKRRVERKAAEDAARGAGT